MKREEILQKLANGRLSVDKANRLLADTDEKRGTLYCKVSQKGALSVYGFCSTFLITLYVGQWERLLDFSGTKSASS